MFHSKVFIHVKWPRFKCPYCDNHPTTSFKPPWLGGNGELTLEYENNALKWLINSTIKDVALKLKTTEEVIEGIVSRRVNTEIDWNRISPTKIGLDEIALRKGHKHYLTIVSDTSEPENIKILGVIDGRKKDDIRPFLQSIPKDILLSLEAITIDMSASYFPALKERLDHVYEKDDEKGDVFNRIVTLDRFHVAKLLGDHVDKERKKMTDQLKKEYKDDEETLNNIKGTMWPFRHHKKDVSDVSDEDQAHLDSLFEMSPLLKECYDLRESLYNIFETELSLKDAEKKIDEWIESAEKYKKTSNPFTSFIKTYKTYKCNILNYFRSRSSNGPVEGLNNKIKVIKRRGFGFRNVTNFARRLFLDLSSLHIHTYAYYY